jgi:hypothetical protein
MWVSITTTTKKEQHAGGRTVDDASQASPCKHQASREKDASNLLE